MITYKQGNLLDDDAEALVNTVNTVGVMGKGIALAFKNEFPENFHKYKEACNSGKVKTGKMFITVCPELTIINFPTKKHWADPSKLEWIEEGLKDLVKVIEKYEITSIALPALGCSNGRLLWKNVKPLIKKYLGKLEVDVRVYEPL